MREYYVNWRNIGMNDRAHHPGYGTRGSHWYQKAPNASTACARIVNGGLVEITAVWEIKSPEVQKAEADSFEALKVALKERGRL